MIISSELHGNPADLPTVYMIGSGLHGNPQICQTGIN